MADSTREREDMRIDLMRVADIIQEHVTKALCRSVYQDLRIKERVRDWPLYLMVQFWNSIVLRAPRSLTQALDDLREGRDRLLPTVKTSPEAFFQRCHDLRWEFFAEVFRRFLASLKPRLVLQYCSDCHPLLKRFTGVYALDGSQLAPVARRLKIARRQGAAIIPGSLMVVYNVFLGIPERVHFSPDAAKNEWLRAQEVLQELKTGSLVIGDRLYGTVQMFLRLEALGLWGICRRTTQLSLKRQQCLLKVAYKGGVLEDWLVLAGKKKRRPTLRYIRFRKGGKVRVQLLMNVLDSTQLTAIEAIELYWCRWKIERLFFDLKTVLNLNRIYPSHPNAVGMQVYASALVYTAMRVAQADVAQQAGITPEEISPAKFYPKMAASFIHHANDKALLAEVVRLNPDTDLTLPNLKASPWASVQLNTILVEERKGKRRKRARCNTTSKWKSYAHLRGGRKLARI